MIRQSFSESLFLYIEKKSVNKYYPYFLALSLLLLSWLLVFTNILVFYPVVLGWQVLLFKVDNLTSSLTHLEEYSWVAKKVFRLTIPFLMKVFSVGPLGVVIFQVLTGYFIFILAYKITLKLTDDSVQATLLTIGIAFLYFGRAAFFDQRFTWFDSFAWLFLLSAMYSRRYIIVFLFCTLAAWTDERAFIALSLVFAFHFLNSNNDKKLISVNHLLKLNSLSISVILAGISYLSLRFFLAYKLDMHTPNEGANLGMVKETFIYAQIGFWTFLEGFWVVFILGVLVAIKYKDYLRAVFFTLPILVLSIVSICVEDITRSGSYIVPIIFVIIQYMQHKYQQVTLRIILLFFTIISFIYPPIFVVSSWPISSWLYSTFKIFPDIINTVFGLIN
ncbi:MAG: hypothetical protein HRU40_21870 [Saprospiraceae bacterium]|nr:hypothetical protein [Saprospiraceae bacterium]